MTTKAGAALMLSAAMLLPSAAVAQTVPYKLVISWYQSNLTVIDYPTKARCEAAAAAVRAEVARRSAESDAMAPPGTVRVSNGPNGAFCIPG